MPVNDDSSEIRRWERQPDESEAAFLAFAAYRDQTRPRSLARLSREFGKSSTLLERFSSRHAWVSRASAFDIHRDRQRLESRRRENEDLGRRQAQHLGEILEVVMKPVEALARRIEELHVAGEDPYKDMSVPQLQRLANRSIAAIPKILVLERLVNGIGVNGPVDRDYGERTAAREKSESMTRQEMLEFLLGATGAKAVDRADLAVD